MKRENLLSGRQWLRLGSLFAIALIISLFSYFPEKIEQYYSEAFYPSVSNTLRLITRWAPFSIGDLVYCGLVIFLTVKLVKLIIGIFKKRYDRYCWLDLFFGFIRLFLWVYIIFKLVWGLNYERLGIAYQLQLFKKEYTREEVTQLTNQLIDTLNACRRQIPDSILSAPPLDSVYREAFNSYRTVSVTFPFLNYRNLSLKASLFSPVGDYMGFSGYYNPFTGEAQVRSDIPRILIPYIACHEMAHQLGYASESEANFVGYLSAAASKNVYFRYSVYLDLFSYAQGEEIMMYAKEKDFKKFASVFRENRLRLDTLVKQDRKRIREFFNKRKNRISPAVSGMYDQYLKMNRQFKGVDSYNEVVGWLIAYQKKYGRI